MGVIVRGAAAADLDGVVALAVRSQARPDTAVLAVGDDATTIRTEIAGTQGWPAASHVAVGDGRIVGWLMAETDRELARVWWWGPLVTGEVSWHVVADELYAAARSELDLHFEQEELSADHRNTALAAFAHRHGFHTDEPSTLLRITSGPTHADPRVRPLRGDDAEEVAALHDRLFAGTHTTGRQLVDKADGARLVLYDGPDLLGYVAVETLPDGIGYIDFLGVDPPARRQGAGRALVAAALDRLRREGVATIDLTVRESNRAARSLYRSLGFREVRTLLPYRKGFTLDS